ncbi:carbohydrate binding domain-containing protein, partial [Cellulomonas bogoriensis]|uniref:carbohydrate binding domain-containing protein n=1 Tax=Cellulomonas bogoriensis TaxID=301388 RepID=UPI0012EBED63
MRRPKVFEIFGVGVAATALIAAPAAGAAPAPTVVAAPDGVLHSIDFEDGADWSPWTRSGEPELEVIELDGNGVLHVGDRGENYDGIELATDGLEGELTVSLDLMLAEGTPEVEAGLVTVPGYTHRGAQVVGDDEWTTVTATFEAPAEKVYIGTADIADVDAYDYYVDNIVVTLAAPSDEAPGDGDAPAPAPGENVVIHETGFEAGTDGWFGRGDAEVEVTDAEAHEGDSSLHVTNRSADWHGAAMNLFPLV